jgi:hypothetical protein
LSVALHALGFLKILTDKCVAYKVFISYLLVVVVVVVVAAAAAVAVVGAASAVGGGGGGDKDAEEDDYDDNNNCFGPVVEYSVSCDLENVA